MMYVFQHIHFDCRVNVYYTAPILHNHPQSTTNINRFIIARAELQTKIIKTSMKSPQYSKNIGTIFTYLCILV